MKSVLTKIQVVVVAVILLVLAASLIAAQDPLAITPVTVVDMTDGSLAADQTVLVGSNRIVAVGSVGEITVPEHAEVVDGADAYLIPGLWDMHAHAAVEGRPESFFRLFLANGITGYRDMFGSLEIAQSARKAVHAGELSGPPRIVAAGNLVDGPPGIVPGASVVASPSDGRRIVDSLHTAGAPFVKVYFFLSPETYDAIAERSRELNLPFVGHVPTQVRAAHASDAGQRSIEHLTGVLEGCSAEEEAVLAEWEVILEQLAGRDRAAFSRIFEPFYRALATQDDDRCRSLLGRFVENETWQVPTLVSLRGKAYLREFTAAGDPRTAYFVPPNRWTGGRPFGFPMTEEQWQVLQGRYEREKEIVGMMAEAGVPLLAGSDSTTPWAFPGFGLHDELELLVDAGLTPLQALQAATLNPARFFGRSKELGTVRNGKLADLVLLEGNPLQDITNTRRIRAVVADGRIYRRAELDRLLSEVQASVEQVDTKE